MDRVLGEMGGYRVKTVVLENGETLLEIQFTIERILLPISALFVLNKLFHKASAELLGTSR